MLVQAEIASFALDPERNTPVIILREVNGNRTLPIGIGPLEASAIAIESLNVVPEKPLTIDLVKIVMENLGGALERVIITGAQGQSIESKMQVKTVGALLLIDCRPCDSIALALRCGVDIFIDDSVFDRTASGEMTEKERLRQRIRSIDTIEFGKYFLE